MSVRGKTAPQRQLESNSQTVAILICCGHSRGESTVHQADSKVVFKGLNEFASVIIFVPTAFYCAINHNNRETVQIVEPNNNTVHQQPYQPDQSAGQSLQFNQLDQPLMNNPEYTNCLQRLTSIITTPSDVKRRRPIFIDGLNIGFNHGHEKRFSARGILLCVQYFVFQGFESVVVMLPQHYRGAPGTETHSVLDMVNKIAQINFTPSRKIKNERLTCYTDRILLDHASYCGGVVVSNDNFRDIYDENERYKEIIEKRQLMFMFIGDLIVFPPDQYGKRYPHLHTTNIVHFPA
ncbi:hypothetical protein ACI65C_012278 [Semiaphis heraclei]